LLTPVCGHVQSIFPVIGHVVHDPIDPVVQDLVPVVIGHSPPFIIIHIFIIFFIPPIPVPIGQPFIPIPIPPLPHFPFMVPQLVEVVVGQHPHVQPVLPQLVVEVVVGQQDVVQPVLQQVVPHPVFEHPVVLVVLQLDVLHPVLQLVWQFIIR